MKINIRPLYLLLAILFTSFTSVVYGEKATINTNVTPAVISVGKVSAQWRGVLEIPLWANTRVSLVDDTILTVKEEINSFRFKIDWRGNNTSGFDEKALIIFKVEKESYPYSGRWELIYEKGEEVTCNRKSVDLREFFTPTIIQKEPEARYKFVARVDLPIGPPGEEKVTFITVRFSSGSTYTYLPYLLLTILHDPSGDESYTGIISQTSIEHTLGIRIGEFIAVADTQPKITLTGRNGKLEFEPLSRNSIRAIYTPLSDLKSELNSSDPSLIGPGLGDVYVIAKNLPLKLTFSKTEKGTELYFKIVSQQEAGLPPGKEFDIITIPSAVLRSYEEGRPIFGTWKKYGIDDYIRTELIDKNIGWDNKISSEEGEKVIDLGPVYLNVKEKKTKFRYTQQTLVPVILKAFVKLEPAFTQDINIVTYNGKTPFEILLNHEKPAKIISNKNILVDLEDKERSLPKGDFFTYHAYIDRQFGTLLFITKDDKNKPANLTSLQYRSLSSNPTEYWTGEFEPDDKVAIAQLPTTPIEKIKLPTPPPSVKVPIPPIPEEITVEEKPKISEKMPTVKEALTKEEVVERKEIILPKEIEPEIVKEVKEEVSEPILVAKIPQLVEKQPEVVTATPERRKSRIPRTLMNSDFSLDLEYWKKIDDPPDGKRILQVVYDAKDYPKVLEFKKIGRVREKSKLGVWQPLNLEVSESSSLVVGADVKVIFSLSDSDEDQMYPVMIELEYEDVNGNVNVWKHGFLSDDLFKKRKINYPEIGEKIPKNRWYSYLSPDLMKILSPKPRLITKLKIYGAGMGFKGRVDNVKIIVEETPTFPPVEKPAMVVKKVPVEPEAPPPKKEVKIPMEMPAVEKVTPSLQEKALPDRKVEIAEKAPPPAPKEEEVKVSIKTPAIEKVREVKPSAPEEIPPIKITPPPLLKEKKEVKPQIDVKAPVDVPAVKKVEPPIRKKILSRRKVEVSPEVSLPPSLPKEEVKIPVPKEEVKIPVEAPIVEKVEPSVPKEIVQEKKVEVPVKVPPPPPKEEVKIPADVPAVEKVEPPTPKEVVVKKKVEIPVKVPPPPPPKEEVKIPADVPAVEKVEPPTPKEVVVKKKVEPPVKVPPPPPPKEEVKIPADVPAVEKVEPPTPKEVVMKKKVELPVKVPPPPPPKEEVKIPADVPAVEKVEPPTPKEIPPKKKVKVLPKVPPTKEKVEVLIPVEKVVVPLSELTNADFKNGLEHWQRIEIGSGKKEIKVIRESKKYPNVLKFKRSDVQKERGKLGVSQLLNIDISEYVYLAIKADVKVTYASLKSDGTEGGDYPVTIELEYEDALGDVRSFRRGFLNQKWINYPNIGETVPTGKWHSYISPNLIDVITPKPRIIKGIKIYGSGEAFEGRVANVQLIRKKTLPPLEAPVEIAAVPQVLKKEELLPPEIRVEPKVPGEIISDLKIEKPPLPVQPEKLLNNGNFINGLKNWEKIEIGGGINKISVIKDSDEYPNVLEFTRVATAEGKLGVSQSLWMNVTNFLVLTADVKVLYSSFFTDKYVESGYPLILELEYIDVEGKPQVWKKGFRYQNRMTKPETDDEIVREKTWYSFTSENLIPQLSPKPKVITKINIYGSGWGFWTRVTNIRLMGE